MKYPHQVQPELELVSFDTTNLLTELRGNLFPSILDRVQVGYVRSDSLASIQKLEPGRWSISLHSILNHPDTPQAVVQHILIHELIHIEIRPRLLSSAEWKERWAGRCMSKQKRQKCLTRETAHPPEFFERERLLSSNGASAIEWINNTFGSLIRHDENREGIVLRRHAYKSALRLPRPMFPVLGFSEHDRRK